MRPHSLILRNLCKGQRNYFDCYESAIGGLVAIEINNYNFVLNFYSQLDCLALILGDQEQLLLQPRPIDLNILLLNLIGYELSRVSLDELLLNLSSYFVIEFDEFYTKENSHYRKQHFDHASLGVEILNKFSFKVVDPELIVSSKDSYSDTSRIISFDNTIYDKKDKIFFYILKRKNNNIVYCDTNWQNETSKRIFEANIHLWLGEAEIKNKKIFYGFSALKIFLDFLTNFSKIELAVREFYKWIFPLFWKREFLRKNCLSQKKDVYSILEKIINEMEIFETMLLRLVANYETKLHASAIIRWENIMSLLSKYVQLEKLNI